MFYLFEIPSFRDQLADFLYVLPYSFASPTEKWEE